VLDDIGGLYNAPEADAFDRRAVMLGEHPPGTVLGPPAFFFGESFSLVDAAFAPVFRYFDVLEPFVQLGVFAGKPRIAAWRRAVAERPSVKAAVDADYPQRLESVRSVETLAALTPDMARLTELSDSYDLVGFYVFTTEASTWCILTTCSLRSTKCRADHLQPRSE
jgi:hypothetical protein